MQNARLDEAHAGIKIAGRKINNLRYTDDTIHPNSLRIIPWMAIHGITNVCLLLFLSSATILV